MADPSGSPLVSLDHEAVVVRRGSRSGVYTVIAVHSTVLGPALGGCRMSSYQSAAEAVRDALRLSRGMTYKSAAAGLPLGGGKAVIAIQAGVDRDAMLLDLADSIESLDGLYITAEDVGTNPADMELIHTRTNHVVGLPPEKGGGGDPSPFTAAGGIIHAAEEYAGEHDPDRVAERLQGIHDVVAQILEATVATGRTPLTAAYEIAARRLEVGRVAAPD